MPSITARARRFRARSARVDVSIRVVFDRSRTPELGDPFVEGQPPMIECVAPLTTHASAAGIGSSASPLHPDAPSRTCGALRKGSSEPSKRPSRCAKGSSASPNDSLSFGDDSTERAMASSQSLTTPLPFPHSTRSRRRSSRMNGRRGVIENVRQPVHNFRQPAFG